MRLPYDRERVMRRELDLDQSVDLFLASLK